MPDPIRTSPTSLPNAKASGASYAVKPGDTLYKIAQSALGDGNRWQEILNLNKGILPSPERLGVGMVLALPTGAVPPAAPEKKPEAPKPSAPASSVDRFEKVVSLTFDDGPQPVNTPRVLDILKAHGVKGTFFVTGANAEKYPELIKRIVAEGHALGNHTYTHANLSKCTAAQAKAEFDRCQAAIDKALGAHYDLKLVRPPYGATGPQVKAALAPGQQIVLWNVDSNDWRYAKDDQKIFQNIFEGAYGVHARGGTILFHDIHPQTVRVLDEVISRLQRSGFDIQRTDAALGAKRPAIG